MIRAAVLDADGDFRVRDDVTTKPLLPGSVRVRMMAAGVCQTDKSAITGAWPTKLPAVLGHEGAGVVVEAGSQVEDLTEGDHVVLARLRGCGHCRMCLRDQPFLCLSNATTDGGDRGGFVVDGQDGFGIVGLGTWAEELTVPARNVVRVDPDVPFEIASLVGCAVQTGVGAVIRTADVRAGASVLIIGGGGIGSASVLGAVLAGAAVIAVVEPSEQKHQALHALGADHVVTPTALPELLAHVTGGEGFDYVFESVGRPATIRSAWDAARRGGTVVLSGIGHSSEQIAFNPHELTMDAKRILGSVGGSVHSARDLPLYIDLWRAGRLALDKLIGVRLVLDDVVGAVERLGGATDGPRQVISFDRS